MATLAIFKNQFFDANGKPLAGGKVWTYDAGTTNPKATYTDATGLVANTNPVILDSAGMANIWMVGNYKVTVTDSLDIPIYTIDNVNNYSASAQVLAGDGLTTIYTVSSSSVIGIYINGVYQNKSSYTLVGTTLTFSAAPPVNSVIEVTSI